jgi:hypothetical protein
MNWILFALSVIGIGGPLVSAFFAILGTFKPHGKISPRIHIVPSDSIIDSPSRLEVKTR